MTTEAKLLADRLRYLSQNKVGLKESLEIVDKLPRIIAILDLVAYPKPSSGEPVWPNNESDDLDKGSDA